MTGTKGWTVELQLEESPDHTDARAVLRQGGTEFTGWGRARRNPSDPDVPEIGDELAVARALSDLSHHLVDAAARAIEEYEGRQVNLRH
jgi:hypothetical protein